MMTTRPIRPIRPILEVLNPPSGAVPITFEQANAIGIMPFDIAKGEKRFDMETRGPWGIVKTIRAIATASQWGHESISRPCIRFIAFGPRTMNRPRDSGYHLEGRVSIGGKKYRAFTASQLFELPDGKLIDVATLHVCGILEDSAARLETPR